jgi:hypothetical protein
MARPLLKPVPMTRQTHVRKVGIATLTVWLLTFLAVGMFGLNVGALVSLGVVVLMVALLLLKWIGYGMRESRGETDALLFIHAKRMMNANYGKSAPKTAIGVPCPTCEAKENEPCKA